MNNLFIKVVGGDGLAVVAVAVFFFWCLEWAWIERGRQRLWAAVLWVVGVAGFVGTVWLLCRVEKPAMVILAAGFLCLMIHNSTARYRRRSAPQPERLP